MYNPYGEAGAYTLEVSLASGPSHGQLDFRPDGSFTYTPDYHFVGTDSFTYSLKDHFGTTQGTVNLELVNHAPVAVDDSQFAVPHNWPLNGSVGDNDSDPNADGLTFTLVSDVSNGTLTFNPDGTFDYMSERLFVGEETFTYQASDGITTSNIATVTINVTNSAPVFAPVVEGLGGGFDLPSDTQVFTTGQILGQLEASDAEMDSLTFSGSSDYIEVTPDGLVRVTNGEGLTQHMESGGSITMQVKVTDGIDEDESTFTLNWLNEWHWTFGNYGIWIEDSAGSSWTASGDEELVYLLEQLHIEGRTVTSLIIKVHGGPDGIKLEPGGVEAPVLSVSGSDGPVADQQILIDGVDYTDLFKDLTNQNTTIVLGGCYTLPLALQMQTLLGDGAKVHGGAWYILGIPGTSWSIGDGH
jgi:hypothetical protein